jgi:molybdopterin synthase sulfur carrier subunit
MINVVFFAALREQLNCAQISIPADAINTVEDVKQALCNKDENWQQALNKGGLLTAVNHTMVSRDHSVKSGDEVAFFPPVTGG